MPIVTRDKTRTAGTKQGQAGTKKGTGIKKYGEQKSVISPLCPCFVPALFVPVWSLLICHSSASKPVQITDCPRHSCHTNSNQTQENSCQAW